MRKARENRGEPFSGDKVHPGNDGQLVIARTILSALGAKPANDTLATINADPHFKLPPYAVLIRPGRGHDRLTRDRRATSA